tara:strand:+ start:4536 stop:5486 length:951 start_codon:yes stop_codon:yes gene_type:complete
MNKSSHLVKIFILYFLTQCSYLHSAIQENIVAKVEDQIISSYELKNKIKTILFLSNQQLNQNNINSTKNEAMRALVNFKLKKKETKNLRNTSNLNNRLNGYLDNVAKNYNTNKQGLKKKFIDNALDFDLFIDEIKTEFIWQRLIYNLYKNKLTLDDKEVDQELNNFIQNQKNIEEYKLSEIEVASNNEINDREKIEEIKYQIKSIGFENTAIKFSTTSSALNGGDIGWISAKSLSNEILNILKVMKSGEISKPIIRSNTILFLKLIDKKIINVKDIDLNQVKQNIINAKKDELLNLFSTSHLSKIKNNAYITYLNK